MGQRAPAANHQVPSSTMQRILRRHLGDGTADVNVLRAEPMQHGGFGGNTLYRAGIPWTATGGGGAALPVHEPPGFDLHLIGFMLQ
jgi:hypothetical protein